MHRSNGSPQLPGRGLFWPGWAGRWRVSLWWLWTCRSAWWDDCNWLFHTEPVLQLPSGEVSTIPPHTLLWSRYQASRAAGQGNSNTQPILFQSGCYVALWSHWRATETLLWECWLPFTCPSSWLCVGPAPPRGSSGRPAGSTCWGADCTEVAVHCRPVPPAPHTEASAEQKSSVVAAFSLPTQLGLKHGGEQEPHWAEVSSARLFQATSSLQGALNKHWFGGETLHTAGRMWGLWLSDPRLQVWVFLRTLLCCCLPREAGSSCPTLLKESQNVGVFGKACCWFPAPVTFVQGRQELDWRLPLPCVVVHGRVQECHFGC